MKLIIAILRDSDNEPVSRALTTHGFRVTQIASTGGFLRHGSTTLLIGVDDNQVDEGLELVRNSCAPASEPNTARGTIFVIPVERYTHL